MDCPEQAPDGGSRTPGPAPQTVDQEAWVPRLVCVSAVCVRVPLTEIKENNDKKGNRVPAAPPLPLSAPLLLLTGEENGLSQGSSRGGAEPEPCPQFGGGGTPCG